MVKMINARFGCWIFKFWPLNRFGAITMPWGIYFKKPYAEVSIGLIHHELTHIRQMKEIGFLKFWLRYVGQYIRNWFIYKNHKDAYHNISFEIEANKVQSEWEGNCE